MKVFRNRINANTLICKGAGNNGFTKQNLIGSDISIMHLKWARNTINRVIKGKATSLAMLGKEVVCLEGFTRKDEILRGRVVQRGQ